MLAASKEGYLPFKGHKTFYRVFGDAQAGKIPLLVLHGGPGNAHNYLLGLSELARNGRQVVFYDQLGGGRSDQVADKAWWTVDTFVQEVKAVRDYLGLTEVSLLGHSWGGMLAIEYLLTNPTGVNAAVLASAMISLPLFQAEVEKLKAALPRHTYETLKKHEAAGTTDSTEYKRAYSVYKKHHLYVGGVLPAELRLPISKNGDAIYHYMWGASEAFANGTLQKWDRVDRLSEIEVPTLITSGQYDELTPWQAGMTRDRITDSQLRIFTNGRHLVHVEQSQDYLNALGRFLDANN